MTAFKNKDGSIAVVMANYANYDIKFNLCMNDMMFKDTIKKDSIISYVFSKNKC